MSSSPVGQVLAPVATAEGAERAESKADAESHPEPTSAREGVLSLVVYAACLAMILSGLPALSIVALPPVIISMVLAMQRRHGFLHGSFQSYIGCLALFPNAIIASVMGNRLRSSSTWRSTWGSVLRWAMRWRSLSPKWGWHSSATANSLITGCGPP